MTTAPDLPLPQPSPWAEPAAAPAATPALRLVPDQPVGDPDDEIGLGEALRRAAPRLKRYAVRRLYDDHEAEEVVQEAMLRAFQHRHELATEDDLMAWLTVVTGRLVIDRLRVRGRSTPVAELPPQSRAGRDTADVVVARDEARIALDALEAMPGRQASVLWAREVEGLSYDEIGERFEMTEPTVRSILHRARKTLRREYESRGGSLPAFGLVALAPWLRGLRGAARIRHVARKGAGAAALAATGLVAMTAVPFGLPWSTHSGGAQHQPALRLTPSSAIVHTSAAVRRVLHRDVDSRPASTVSRPRTTAPAVQAHTMSAPHLCGSRVGVNCESHGGHETLYIGPALPVPVAGVRRVGVSKDGLDCSAVPTTSLTKCDHRGESQ
jgi:RNA polymerase sigma-70 factor (ECF subfamily)